MRQSSEGQCCPASQAQIPLPALKAFYGQVPDHLFSPISSYSFTLHPLYRELTHCFFLWSKAYITSIRTAPPMRNDLLITFFLSLKKNTSYLSPSLSRRCHGSFQEDVHVHVCLRKKERRVLSSFSEVTNHLIFVNLIFIYQLKSSNINCHLAKLLRSNEIMYVKVFSK